MKINSHVAWSRYPPFAEGKIMSHSRRKTPVFGMTTAQSEKEDKRTANRKFRRATRRNVNDPPTRVREVADVWSFAKDGKKYLPSTHPYLLKNGSKIMRK
jgi:hypothetical protein